MRTKSRYFFVTPVQQEVLTMVRKAEGQPVTISELSHHVYTTFNNTYVSESGIIYTAINRINKKAGAPILEKIYVPNPDAPQWREKHSFGIIRAVRDAIAVWEPDSTLPKKRERRLDLTSGFPFSPEKPKKRI